METIKYIDTGVNWLGKIPNTWESKRIKVLTRVKRGASPRPIDNPIYFDEEGEFAWVRIADVTASERYLENTTQRLSELGSSLSVKRYPDDFFLSIAGTVGKPIITKIKCCIHDGFVYFPDLKINPEFLYYIFSTGLPYLGLGKLGTQLNLNTDTVGDIYIPIPEEKEIEKIVSFLDERTAEIDNLISKKQKLIECLKEEKIALINQAVIKGMYPENVTKFSGDKWLGYVPASWEIKKIKYVSKVQGRVGFKGYSKQDIVTASEGALTIGAKHIQDNKITLLDPEYISWEKYYESPEIFVEQGQILVVQRGSLGKVAIVEEDLGEATINPSMVILKNLEINPKYLFYLLSSAYFTTFIELINASTAVPMISQEQLENLVIPKPSNEEMEAIVKFIEEKVTIIHNTIFHIEQEIELIKEYRISLINEVVTGKITLN
jgi:type I restriction enzyme S subunit